ncbi:mechanosensitive ion channel family protein [Cyanobium sp. FGCU-6]|nr:mechanosensitive ion channel family protein [Cyanobium sp. FGCU6]
MSRRCPAPIPWILLLLLVVALPALPAVAAAPAPSAPKPAWVTLEGRRVLEIRSAAGAQTPEALARRMTAELARLADRLTLDPQRLAVEDDPPYAMVGIREADGRFTAKLAVDDRAARAFGISRRALAERYRDQLREALLTYRRTHSLGAWLRGTALALLVLAGFLLWVRLQSLVYLRLRRWLARPEGAPLHGLRLAGNQVLDEAQERASLEWGLRLLHVGLLLLAGWLLIPLLLSLFPPTQVIAEGLRGHILRVLDRLLVGMVAAIPNLLAIALILLLTRLAIRASNAWFRAIERGSLSFPGFYQEWARPTARLVGVALLVVGLVVAYPYVPGSGSRVFQGAGLFVGVLAALGSSAVASNVISGLMLIYTRAFREGDRVEINGVVGVVQDRDLLVTRVQTPRNELVSIPNATVIASSIVNFSFARREIQRPVALAAAVTIGYDVPWREVHRLLLAAAAAVPEIDDRVPPYVLQTSLNDSHIGYELNACVKEVNRYRETLSALLAAIQDQFAAADVEILSPLYHAMRDGNPRTIPPLEGSVEGSAKSSAG